MNFKDGDSDVNINQNTGSKRDNNLKEGYKSQKRSKDEHRHHRRKHRDQDLDQDYASDHQFKDADRREISKGESKEREEDKRRRHNPGSIYDSERPQISSKSLQKAHRESHDREKRDDTTSFELDSDEDSGRHERPDKHPRRDSYEADSGKSISRDSTRKMFRSSADDRTSSGRFGPGKYTDPYEPAPILPDLKGIFGYEGSD